MMKNAFKSLLALVFGFSMAAQAGDKVYTAADMKVAAKDYKKVCFQCHGKDGIGKARMNKKTGKPMINAMMGPRIAGLGKDYSEKQLMAIAKGARKNKNTISMKSKVAKFKEPQLLALAYYVSVELGKKHGKHKGMLEADAVAKK